MRARSESEVAGAATLTPAEVRILELLPTHLTLAQIGADLFVSRNTAKSQVAAIYRKLLVENRDEAVHRARELGLLPSQPEGHAPPARADEQGVVLAFPTARAAREAGRAPEAPVPTPPTGRTVAILRQVGSREQSTAWGEPVTSPDGVPVLAHGWAARSQAGEVRARAREARRVSFLLRESLHRLPLQSGGEGAKERGGTGEPGDPSTRRPARHVSMPSGAALAIRVGCDVKPCIDSG